MPGSSIIKDMGAKPKPTVDPWARSKTNDRFSGPNSMNAKVYEAERAKTPVKARPSSPKTGSSNPLGTTPKPRASSAPKARPVTPVATNSDAAAVSSTTPVPHIQAPRTPNAFAAPAKSPKATGNSPEQPLGTPGGGKSPAFASSKGRFDKGPGSYVSTSAAPGPGQFNPNDIGGMGAVKSKPSPGMVPSAKDRFAGPGSLYAKAAAPVKKQSKKKAPAPEDVAAEEWSKRLGLGALAGAKAAPVLKAVDEAREKAETTAAEAVAAKEAAEAAAEEAMRKADWMTDAASRRVAEAAERAEAAEAEAASLRVRHEATAAELTETKETLAATEAEVAELRRELEKYVAKRGKSPSQRDQKVVDRRPVRLRGQIDADKEELAVKAEERKKKREEHWKKVEQERIEKEDRIRAEQLAKSQASSRASARSGGPPPSNDALKAFALVLPNKNGKAESAAGGSASKRSARSERQKAAGSSPAVVAPETEPEHQEFDEFGEPVAHDTAPPRKVSPFHKSPAKGKKATASPAKPRPVAAPLGSSASEAAVDMPAAQQEPVEDAAARSEALPTTSASRAATPPDRPQSGRPTGMASASQSPEASPTSGAQGGSPVALDDNDAFAAAEAEAEQLAREEARKVSDNEADAAVRRLSDSDVLPSLDTRLGGVKGAALMGPDDTDDITDGDAARDAAAAALKAVTGSSTTALFQKDSYLGSSSSNLSSSLSGIKLSESLSAMPHDDFLSRLKKAEELPTSPGGNKARLGSGSGFANTVPALFDRGVVA